MRPDGIGGSEQGTQIARLLDCLRDQEERDRSGGNVLESHVELAEDADHPLRPAPIRGTVEGHRGHRHLGIGPMRRSGETGRVVVDLEWLVTAGDSPVQISDALDEEHRFPVTLLAVTEGDEALYPRIRRRGDIHQTAQRSRCTTADRGRLPRAKLPDRRSGEGWPTVTTPIGLWCSGMASKAARSRIE